MRVSVSEINENSSNNTLLLYSNVAYCIQCEEKRQYCWQILRRSIYGSFDTACPIMSTTIIRFLATQALGSGETVTTPVRFLQRCPHVSRGQYFAACVDCLAIPALISFLFRWAIYGVILVSHSCHLYVALSLCLSFPFSLPTRLPTFRFFKYSVYKYSERNDMLSYCDRGALWRREGEGRSVPLNYSVRHVRTTSLYPSSSSNSSNSNNSNLPSRGSRSAVWIDSSPRH